MADFLDQVSGSSSPFATLYKTPDTNNFTESAGELADLYKLFAMSQYHPDKSMDLLSIFNFLKRQNMDKELNDSQFRMKMDKNNIRNQETKYLDPKGWDLSLKHGLKPYGGWDISPQYNFTGRRM